MLRYLSFTVFALSLFLVGCEKESIDIIEEVPETVDPVVVEVQDENQESLFFLRMPSGDTIDLNGQGVIDDLGIVGLVTNESSYVECQDGIITFNFGGPERGFYLALSSDPTLGQDVFLGGAFDLPGLAENSSAFIAPDCSTEEPTLDITTLTEDRIAGVYTSEFFTAPFGSVDCENLTSLGIVKVVLNVALTRCE